MSIMGSQITSNSTVCLTVCLVKTINHMSLCVSLLWLLYFRQCHITSELATISWITHWGRDKMAAISQTTLSIAFFVNENVRILIKFSLKFVPKGPITNFRALVQTMAWRRPGDKPLSEPVMVSLLTHICVTRPQWVKGYSYDNIHIDMKFHIQTLLWTFFSERINSPGPYFICLVHVRDFWTLFHGHQFAGQESNWEI